MSETVLITIFAGFFGIALEATRQWMTRSSTQEENVTDDVSAFRKELLDENHQLRKQRDDWQLKYYEERDARLKAQWQLEAMEWLKEERKTGSENDQVSN